MGAGLTQPVPLVTVVIPVLDRERFIAAAIRSVLDQDYPSVEVIVVDGGSEDETPSIARSFPVHYIQQTDAGVTTSKNAGLAAAKGEFISFFDSDDVMMQDKLSSQVGFLVDHPETDGVLARHELLIEPGTEEPDWLSKDPVFGDPGGVDPISAVYRKSALDSVGGFDTSFHMAEGMELLGRMREAGLVISVLDQIVYQRRIHGSNVSRDRRAMGSALLQSLKGHIDRGKQT